MTADHFFLVLDSEGDSVLLADVGSVMAQGTIPDEEASRLLEDQMMA